MQKKLISASCAIILSLSVSCSYIVLPKRVEITGTVNLPARMEVADFGALFDEVIQGTFSGDKDDAKTKVYDVDYEGQIAQTFCIYIPIAMTENLNPSDFLNTINRQINNGTSAEPREIDVGIATPSFLLGDLEVEIDLKDVSLDIPPVFLDDIAKYVVSIDYAPCYGTVSSGIGINFHLEEIIDGLEMVVKCAELDFPTGPKPLKKGDNVFGNSKALILELEDYEDRSKSLVFNIELQSTSSGNRDKLYLSTAGLIPGERLAIMKGSVNFFHNWTRAKIDMERAMRASAMGGEFVGTFPHTNEFFDLSGMGKYLTGGFIFEDLEAKAYMNNPVSFNLNVVLEPQYAHKGVTGSLYEGKVNMDKVPLVLSEYLRDDETYMYQHLPGIEGEYHDDNVNQVVIADIFTQMPNNLTFIYKVKFMDKYWIVYPEMFFDSADDNNKISTTLMIMLPMSMRAISDESVLVFPNMFGKSNDLFGRDEVDEEGKPLGPVELDFVRLSIDLHNSIFNGGRMFLDGDKNHSPLLFFPDGIILTPKNITMNFTDQQIKIAQTQLIKPNIWISFKTGDTVIVPKSLGIVGIKLDKMKATIKTGDISE